MTFYRFPQLTYLENWYENSPESFIFSIKVPRLITHYKQLSGTEGMLGDFYGSIYLGLKEKLGCVLFQFPERLLFNEERLDRIVRSLDPSFTNVVEFRHPSWWNVNVFETLKKYSIVFCGQSHPNLPEEVVTNDAIVYYRFHGSPVLYKSQYQKKKIHDVVDQIRQAENTNQVYIYFNNTMGVAAIRNAHQTLAYWKTLSGQ